MKKFTIFASSWLLTCLTLSAGPLTPEQALQRLDVPQTRSAGIADLKYVHTIQLSNGEPGLYVFDNNRDSGYAILSADDIAAPLLGYSDSGKFDADNMSPEMKWWLEEYTRQIEYGRMMGAAPYQQMTTRAEKEAVAPLVETRWNQNAPYNLQTPEVDGRHCVTGCVATAMAQVMKYWNYPTTGKGTGECTVKNKDNSTRTERMLLDEQNFDWNNMLDRYSEGATEVQTAAVAYLMKACGYATNMKYALDQSGTGVLYVATSLVNNFDYNKNILYAQRSYYTASEWGDLIYDEVAEGRPVVYGGDSARAGHCFVCDGYDSDGYYHFNWGWGGMSDGYFLLDALNPGSLGIGANGGGYNFGQLAVIGIQPTTGKEYAPNFVQKGNLEGSASGVNLYLTLSDDGGWYNMDTKAITIDLGVKIEPISPTEGETIYAEVMSKQTLQVRYGFKALEFTLPSLKDGKYKLTLCFRLSGTEEWTPVRCEADFYNSIEFTKERLKITLIPNSKAEPKIESAEFLTPLYYGDAVKMSVTVSNPSGKELTNYFYPALYSGGIARMTAEGVAITLEPGETATKEFTCMFELLAGMSAPTEETTYQLYFYNPTSEDNSDRYLSCYPDFSQDVSMKIDEFVLDLTVEDFVINGYESTLENGRYVYNVTDATSIPFSMKIINNTEYFAKPIDLVIFPNTPGEVQSLAIEAFTPFALLTQGESAELGVNVNFAAGEIGGSYFAMPYIYNQPLNDYRLYFTLGEYNSVEGIEGENLTISYDKMSSSLKVSGSVCSLVVAAMDGTTYDKSAEASTGNIDLSNMSAGVYVVNAKAQDGSVKTVKIIL